MKKAWLILGIIMFLAGFTISFISVSESKLVSRFDNPTDYHDHYLSQEISDERLAELEREAKEEWIKEYGDTPRNMTSDELAHAKEYVGGSDGN
ncbi:hypothetical protein ACPEEL_02290 [Pasteurella sp. PK-2025]|uniref:hypothetical protein n=1 Tax=unclassified Pasteurella TaxID=2621516 RepID=UPI003C758A77